MAMQSELWIRVEPPKLSQEARELDEDQEDSEKAQFPIGVRL